MVSKIVKNGYKAIDSYCLSKSSPFCTVGSYHLVQISPASGSNTNQIIYEEILDFLVVLTFEMVAQKSFNGNFTAKIDFPIGHFMLPLLKLTLDMLEVRSLSIHYLISIWITCWCRRNSNKIVLYEMYKILSFFSKIWLTIFEKVLTLFWRTQRFCDINTCSICE